MSEDQKRLEQMMRIQRLEQIKRIQSLEQQRNAPPEETPEEAGMVRQGLNAMDTTRIPGAMALAGALEKMSGKKVFDIKDYQNPIDRGIPSSYDLMERAGYGGSDANIGDAINPLKGTMGRKALGFGLDIGSDLGTYASGGANLIMKNFPKAAYLARGLEMIGNPIGEVITQGAKGTRAAGKAAYKSAFKNLDNAAERTAAKGTKIPKGFLPSEIMLERGAPSAWTARGNGENVVDVSKQIIRDRDAILDAGLGDDFNFNRMYSSLKTKANELINSGHADQVARGRQILNKIDEQREIYDGLPELRSAGTPDQIRQVETGLLSEFGEPILKDVLVPGEPIRVIQQAVPPRKVTPSSLQKTKQVVGKDMPDVFSGKTSLEKEISNAEYGGIKDEVEAISANPAEVRKLNKQASMLFPTESPQVSLAIAEDMKNPTSTMNMLMAAMNPKIALTKQGLDLILRQGVRSKAGKGMMNTGEFLLKDSKIPFTDKTFSRESAIRALTTGAKPTDYQPWNINYNEQEE